MKPKRIHLITSLTPSECVSRLTAAIEAKPSLVACDIMTEYSLQLRMQGGRNPVRIFLTCTLRPEAGETVISGEVGMQLIGRFLLFVWCGFPVFLAIVSAVSGEWDAAVGLLAMAALFLGAVWFGRFLTRDHPRLLTDFLMQTLNTHA